MYSKKERIILMGKNDYGYKWYWKYDNMKQLLHDRLLYKYSYHIQKE